MKLKNLLHNQTFIGFSFVLMLALLFLDSLEYVELGVFINLILVANAILILNVVTKKIKMIDIFIWFFLIVAMVVVGYLQSKKQD